MWQSHLTRPAEEPAMQAVTGGAGAAPVSPQAPESVSWHAHKRAMAARGDDVAVDPHGNLRKIVRRGRSLRGVPLPPNAVR